MSMKLIRKAYHCVARRYPLVKRIVQDVRAYGRASYTYRHCTSLFVPVLGMHRSGTSAVASLLQANGVSLGEDLIDPNQTNEPGFFESRGAIAINDALLHRLGGSWRDPPPQIPQFSRGLLRQAGRFLHELSASGPVVGWKDPRTTVTWAAWYELLRAQRFQIVAVFRHPNRVAKSLLAIYDDLTFSEAISLWLRYSVRLLALEQDVVWVNFDAPLEQQIQAACARVDVKYDPETMAVYNQRFVHNRDHFASTGNSDADRAYEWMLAKWKRQACPDQAREVRPCAERQSVSTAGRALDGSAQDSAT